MAKVDFSDSGPEGVTGWRNVEVIHAEEKQNKNDDAMFEIELKVGGSDFTVKDWIMCQGKAAAWHSKKLKCLLGRDIRDGEEIEAFDLVGRKAQAFLRRVAREYQGRRKFYINVDAEEGECGYLPEGVDPNEKIEPPEGGFEDIPF